MYDAKLDTFIQVVESGSFTKAAAQLFISPVSVMKQIESLENATKVKLFNRSTKGVTLTAAGKSIYNSALQLIKASETAVEQAQNISKNEKQVIRIGTSLLRSGSLLIDLWSKVNSGELPFNLKIVPFGDDPSSMQKMLTSLGDTLDCFVGPGDSYEILNGPYKMAVLENKICYCAVPRRNHLAKKESLDWSDLDDESLLLVRRGQSPELDQLRTEIETSHSKINIVNTDNFYDIDAFNLSEQENYIMETLDIWKDLHPALVTIPMKWDYKMPYGIIYSNNASNHVRDFIKESEKLYQN
ncbi:LysR family transcriptional regulator [Weissella koreensis]|uniref:LysR family transcriptional regulator n=1 Tax=Weissella koreensis TaxID=165096 RepID=A0A7H1MLV8_9LACO|nr:LysR family transcriptional regulator [Weissella koreensis]AEJ23614.1 transcriptional regulator, LysR family protein [Weissella koreensis KACC 15510]AVH75241.1 LysR family transcriptional regulator [Weissella koreensis]EJF33273.1 hypothetical protein JC2156_10240 [Weissella koreensis KCTC 3621]QGN20465.1 LysR family transcriptional regulator [Weissella koreensis]QNT64444.1 LysR family transcriptional regulator [Weissella koreensis]